ncbi:MAG: SIS domain-containing protein [Alphaproteobacteria bacterium]|jgi:D-sedoheptulose 7-phosphate isomerase|nr:SIS domain-containing protein [Alphaproteobacteria bacterium]MDP6564407.1 SIS domain-containing protein [Alphaproteobacteria bacterium]MDP6815998.1 SIS domain-containing protein [Alphaproteobacteria bacterium]
MSDRNDTAQAPGDQAAALIGQSIALKQDLLAGGADGELARMAEPIAEALARGGKLLLCGNGGSAGDAQHLAGELMVRLRPSLNRRALPALSLATDTSTLTACANDYGYDEIFARPLRALGKPGDALLAISTSGRSANVCRALTVAAELDVARLGFLGGDGGAALALCQQAVVVPSDDTNRIQECHIMLGHILVQLVEEALLQRGYIEPVPG